MSKLHVHVEVPQLALSAESGDGDVVTGWEVAGVGRRGLHAQLSWPDLLFHYLPSLANSGCLAFVVGCMFKHSSSLTKAVNCRIKHNLTKTL